MDTIRERLINRASLAEPFMLDISVRRNYWLNCRFVSMTSDYLEVLDQHGNTLLVRTDKLVSVTIKDI